MPQISLSVTQMCASDPIVSPSTNQTIFSTHSIYTSS